MSSCLVKRTRQQSQCQQIVLIAHFAQTTLLQLWAELFPSLRPSPDLFLFRHFFEYSSLSTNLERS